LLQSQHLSPKRAFSATDSFAAIGRFLQRHRGSIFLSRKFGGPTLQGEALQFGDNFINDQITDLRQFEAGDPPRTYQ
jgi:hypothetical protein